MDGEGSKAGVFVGLPSVNDGIGAAGEESPGASTFDGINVVGPSREVGGLFVAAGAIGVIVVASSVDSEGDIVGSTTSTAMMLISSNSVASGKDKNSIAFLVCSCIFTVVSGPTESTNIITWALNAIQNSSTPIQPFLFSINRSTTTL